MMSEKRFIVESVMIDCLCEDEPRIAKVITDKEELYSYDDLYEISDLLNEQQDKITELEIELTDCKNRKEQLEYKNTKLIAKIDFLERVIDGDINE